MNSLTPQAPLAFIAALPRELAPLARDLGATHISAKEGVLVQVGSLAEGISPVLLVTAGMGANRAALAVRAALAHAPLAGLLSVGLAGACDPSLALGSVFSAHLVIDSQTGERFTTDSSFHGKLAGTLVTAPAIASPAEKRRLHQTYAAAAVDMEAATVARLARAHGLPFGAIKSISDDQAFDLAHLSFFAGQRGEFRTAAFVLHTLLRPATWRGTLDLGRGGRVALASLTGALHHLVASRAAGVA